MRAVLHRHQYRHQHHPANLPCRRSAARCEQGQSFLEFALIVPVLFLMLIGVAFVAQGFNLQMVLYGAAYEGARIWAKNPVGGDFIHCTPPACNPDDGTAKNFEKYVIPSVRQYITTNGFDGTKVYFFAENREGFENAMSLFTNNPQTVKVTLLYPMELPIGNFAGGYRRMLVVAGCALKRGA
jgi:TadE-like protein